LIAVYFARTESLVTFCKGFSLDRKPSDYAWRGVVLALMIRMFGHLMIHLGWAKGVHLGVVSSIEHTQGPERYFFLASLVLLAPFFEEVIYRGFLYRAFRGSYPVAISMAIILAWTANTHWSQYSQSLMAAFGLSLLTIVQCWLREKSDSVWDCILCHLAYNGSSLFVGGMLR
jgi:membrane protease YdiL (CAAX protease family)